VTRCSVVVCWQWVGVLVVGEIVFQNETKCSLGVERAEAHKTPMYKKMFQCSSPCEVYEGGLGGKEAGTQKN
jgi:hypothetical protein